MPCPMSGTPPTVRTLGRYLISQPIAVGGMASVHLGKLNGPAGFGRTVALKRMLQSFGANPKARTMLLDEARLTSRVNHPNVVQTLDVVEDGTELYLVLDYVHGESLDHLLERCRELKTPPSPRIVAAVVVGVLRGLHAAHCAKGEDGQPLELVHRDLSPHNIIVDVHGVPRVLDFGVARARGRLQGTQDGQLKGKLAYLAPEQVHGDSSPRSDLFAAGVVLFEALTLRPLFQGSSEAEVLASVLLCKVPTLSSLGLDAPPLQAVLDRVLDREPSRRFATAAEMADAVEACGVASASELAAWVTSLAAEALGARAKREEELGRFTPPAPAAPARKLPRAAWAVGAAALLGLAAGAYVLTHRAPASDAATPPASSAQTPPPPAGSAQTPPPSAGPAIADVAKPPASPSGPTPSDAVGAHTNPLAADPSPAAELGRTEAPPAVRHLKHGKDAHSRAVSARPEPLAEPGPPAEAARKKEPRKSAACDPPYVIDAAGVKRFKVECFE